MRHLSKKRVEAGVATFAQFVKLAGRLDGEAVAAGKARVIGRHVSGGGFDETIIPLFEFTYYSAWTDEGLAALMTVLLTHAPLADAKQLLKLLEIDLEWLSFYEKHNHFEGDEVAEERDCRLCTPAPAVMTVEPPMPRTYDELREQDPAAFEFVTMMARLKEADRSAYESILAEAREMAARKQARKQEAA